MAFLFRSIASAAAAEASARANRLARIAAFAAIGGVAVLIAAGFLLAALYTLLEDRFGPLASQLGLAGGFLIVGLICFLAARAMRTRPRRRARLADPPIDRGAPVLPVAIAAFALGFARGLFGRRR